MNVSSNSYFNLQNYSSSKRNMQEAGGYQKEYVTVINTIKKEESFVKSCWLLKLLVKWVCPFFCGLQGSIYITSVDREGIHILDLWCLLIGWKSLIVCHVTACQYIHQLVTSRWPVGCYSIFVHKEGSMNLNEIWLGV